MKPAPLPPLALPAPIPGLDLFILAGEHSGDQHAARLVRDLRLTNPHLRIAAIGGPALATAGVPVLHDLTASSVVGFVEVLKNFRYFRALFYALLDWLAASRPRAVLFVDYPGLNLRLAAALRTRGLSVKGGGPIKVLYYVSPQIWAWKAGRRFRMARDLDALATLFPFEPACYADTTLPVEFVGHPFLAADYRPPVRYDPSGPVLLLPGSRRQAVSRIFPALLAGLAAAGNRRAAVAVYPTASIRSVLEAAQPPATVTLRPDGGSEPVAASAVLMSSGTMSMHCALAGIPGAIAYRMHPITYWLARWLVKVRYIGMANLLLDEAMYPELIQQAATPAALATELQAALTDPARLARTQAQAERVRAVLRAPPGVSAAAWVARQLGG